MAIYTRCPDCTKLAFVNGRCTHWFACDECGTATNCGDGWHTADHHYCSPVCRNEADLQAAADEAPEAWERAI